MSSLVAVMGAGGHSRVVSSILLSLGIGIRGFFDNSFSGKPEYIQEAPLLGKFSEVLQYREELCDAYLATGDNQQRRELYNFLVVNDFNVPSLIHAEALVEPDVKIDEATVVCMGAMIGTEVTIGKGCILNTGCSVDHESVIGEFVHLAPQVVVAGRTTIGDNCFVGMNAAIADQITIGQDVVIGAGSVILADIPEGKKIVGVHR